MGSKRSKKAATNFNRYGASRPRHVRSTLPIVVVVCDDRKTAVAYFNELKREVKEKVTLKVVPAPYDGSSPKDVLDCAIKQAEDLKRSHDPEDTEELVWAMIDLEGDLDRQRQADDVKKNSKENGIRIALSKPCYEVWTLAYLVDTGEAFIDCKAVLDRVKVEWRNKFNIEFGPKKAQADYTKLMPLRDTALQSMKKRNPDTNPSWSDVWRIIDDIEKHATP